MSKRKDTTGSPPRSAKVIPFPGPKTMPSSMEPPVPASLAEFPAELSELLQDYEPEQVELVIEMIGRLLQFASEGRIERVPMKLSAAERRSRAQEAVADAFAADDDEMAMAALMDALDFDPENVDALLLLVDRLAGELPDSVVLYDRVVRLAAEQLGQEVFRNDKGHFWLLLETRPYMRARHALARELLYEDRPLDAIAHWQEMLVLNPGDNQGIRYFLLAAQLAEKRWREAGELLAAYPDEENITAPFAWGRVLERLLAADPEGATKALHIARRVNPYMETYLNGTKRVPRKCPSTYSSHTEDEAKVFAQDYAGAWKRHPAARKWLKAHAPR